MSEPLSKKLRNINNVDLLLITTISALVLAISGYIFIKSISEFRNNPNNSNSGVNNNNLTTSTATLLTFEKKAITIDVEVADDSLERQVGLMNRKRLDDDSGMLFIFQKDTDGAFWMKNTLIPLDMIFIDSGYKVVSVIKGAQPCEKDPCQLYSPEAVYRYVIEVNSGWTEEKGVGVGDKVQFSLE